MSDATMDQISARDLQKLKRWRLSTFWVMLLGYVGFYLCRKNLSAALPLLSNEFGYSNTQLGMIAFYSELSYATGKFINGPLGDKIGGRKIFLTGMAGAIVFNIIFGFSGSLSAFIIVWCLCRYFLSMGWGGIVKTMGNWYEPERHGTVMGFISINFQFGGVVATLFAGWLVAMGHGWQDIFFYPAGVLTLVWIWSFLSSREGPQDVVPGTTFGQGLIGKKQLADYAKEHGDQPPVWEIIKTLLKLKIYQQVLVFSILTTMMRIFFFFWTPKFLVDLGLGDSNAILKSAIFPALGCVGTIALGWYTDHYAKNGDRARMMWIMLTGLIASLIAISFLVPFGTEYSDWIVILIGAAGFFLYGPYAMSSGCLTLDIAGRQGAASSAGLIDGLGYVFAALATWGAGAISDTSAGWTLVYQIMAGFAALATLSAWAMSREFQKLAKK